MKYLDTFYILRTASSVSSLYLYRWKLQISPNWFTLLSSVLFVLGLYLAYTGNYLGLVFVILSLFFDFLDGEYARVTKQTSQFGRVLDELTDTAKIPTLILVYFFTTDIPSLVILIAFLWMSFLRIKLLIKNHEIKVVNSVVKVTQIKKSIPRQILAAVPQLYYANVEIFMVYLIISDHWQAGWLFIILITYNLLRVLKKYLEVALS